MSSVLVDTDVFSFMFKQDTRGPRYADAMRGRTPCLSFMSDAELLAWSQSRRWGAARLASLQRSLSQCVVLPYDFAMAQQWASISVTRKRAGRPIATSDCWIAATAVLHDLPLLTHNRRDFGGIEGLSVLVFADGA